MDVVLTRVRLTRKDDEVAGPLSVPKALLNTHTGAGVLALLLWTAFLATDRDALGYLALVPWWVTVVAGLLILARWTPSTGQHSTEPRDTWGDGPGLSVLAHVGLLVGVVVFTALVFLGEI